MIGAPSFAGRKNELEFDENQFISNYRHHGFAAGPILLSEGEINEVRSSIVNLFNDEFDGGTFPFDARPKEVESIAGKSKIDKMNNPWWVSNALRRCYQKPLLGQLAATVMGCKSVRLWKDQIIVKPGIEGSTPDPGNNIGWHQDGSAWSFLSSCRSMCTAWIALQETNVANGCVQFVSGSHKWDFQGKAIEDFYNQDMDQMKIRCESKGLEWKEVPCILQPGQVSFHSAMVVHGSYNNTTPNTRYGVTVHLTPEDTYFLGKEHAMYRQPHIGLLGPNAQLGTDLRREFFPKIWPDPDDAIARQL